MVPIVASGDSRELPHGATRYPADDTNRTRTHSRHHTEPDCGKLKSGCLLVELNMVDRLQAISRDEVSGKRRQR
ncbi:MAG: hypothetical protein CM15mP74_14930 [Halieaceae bacterium]|nr:MAG: hypothetical protein CM15mP74_14930 [Halieaceae bacterium]